MAALDLDQRVRTKDGMGESKGFHRDIMDISCALVMGDVEIDMYDVYGEPTFFRSG